MRKVLPALVVLMLLVPAALSAQGTLRVSSLYGPVEWRAVSSASFAPLAQSTQTVQIGDELRTGSGATVMLELPDGSYMVVSENTSLTIQDYWSGNFKSLVNLMVGKVRFYIQRLGGRPNPYRVTTPTALIAVRGTTFDVIMDESQIVEVRCLEGQVAVESVGLSDREVILEPGRKTMIRPGEYPLTPIANDQAMEANRVIRVVKKSVPDGNSNGTPSVDVLVRDNDRNNRAADPLRAPASRSSEKTDRAKPTLNY
jgi:ferric-dicitrate binding protein FerR (iron transport regulator)